MPEWYFRATYYLADAGHVLAKVVIIIALIWLGQVCRDYVFNSDPIVSVHEINAQDFPLNWRRGWYIFRDAFLNVNANLEGALVSQATSDWNEDPKKWETIQGGDLSNQNLRFANAKRAFLINTRLDGADCSHSDFSYAKLMRASMKGTRLTRAHLRGADLRNADLSGADLWGADLWNADLRGADLTGSNLSRADLQNADLSELPDGPVQPGKRLFSIEQLKTAWHWYQTKLPTWAQYVIPPTATTAQGDRHTPH
jgi:hypothetical protein